MRQRFQKADPGARQKSIYMAIAAAFIGALLILFLHHHKDLFLNWLLSDSAPLIPRLKRMLTVVATMGALPLVGFAVYLWGLGNRIIAARRFPLENQKVVRDTPILEGRSAVARGRILRVLAGFFGLSAIALCFLFWGVFMMVIENMR
jgi:hypothetical protein